MKTLSQEEFSQVLEIQNMQVVKSAAKSNDCEKKHMLQNVHILPFHWNLTIVTNAQEREIPSDPHQSQLKISFILIQSDERLLCP